MLLYSTRGSSSEEARLGGVTGGTKRGSTDDTRLFRDVCEIPEFSLCCDKHQSHLQRKRFISAYKLYHWGKLGQELRLGPGDRNGSKDHRGRPRAGLLSDVGDVEVNLTKEKRGGE